VTKGTKERYRGIGRISYRTAAWLAWSLCALSLALTVLSLLLLNLNLSHPDTPVYGPWLDNTLGAISYAPIGALIASRRPENPVGWLVCLYGFVISVSHFSAEYAIYALQAQPDSLPAGEALAWVLSWILPIIIGLSVFPLLLFPTGRLPSRRWRLVAWLTVVFVLAGVISSALSSGALLGILGPIQNPLGIEGFTNDVYRALLYFMSPTLLIAAAFSLFVRLRRAAGVERQQIKWFTYAAAATVSATFAYSIPGVIDTPPWFEWAGFVLNATFVPAIPVSIGIAILRYRLYDIDLLINRTFVYGSLTATLIAVYFGGVATSQAIFRALTGQEQQPQLAVVVSTLAIAALFNPIRRRIQAFVDRRFYRRKYDAAKTLGAFSARLRDETDLGTLSEELIGAVKETMQPEHISLWLRPDTASRDRRPH
jgi:uncharacterized membrane protein YhdT